MDADEILGRWILDPDDTLALEAYGEVVVEFKEGGRLIYSIIDVDKIQRIFMTYQVKGNLLVTNQDSQPEFEETVFVLSDHVLELYFGGIKSRFIRG